MSTDDDLEPLLRRMSSVHQILGEWHAYCRFTVRPLPHHAQFAVAQDKDLRTAMRRALELATLCSSVGDDMPNADLF